MKITVIMIMKTTVTMTMTKCDDDSDNNSNSGSVKDNRDFKIHDYRRLDARSPMSGGLDRVRSVVACCWRENSN